MQSKMAACLSDGTLMKFSHKGKNTPQSELLNASHGSAEDRPTSSSPSDTLIQSHSRALQGPHDEELFESKIIKHPRPVGVSVWTRLS